MESACSRWATASYAFPRVLSSIIPQATPVDSPGSMHSMPRTFLLPKIWPGLLDRDIGVVPPERHLTRPVCERELWPLDRHGDVRPGSVVERPFREEPGLDHEARDSIVLEAVLAPGNRDRRAGHRRHTDVLGVRRLVVADVASFVLGGHLGSQRVNRPQPGQSR